MPTQATACTSVVVVALPFIVLLSGIAMITSLRYAHVVNKVLRGRHRFARLAEIVLVALMAAIKPEVTLALGFCGYALSGPILWFFRKPQAAVAAPALDKRPSRPPENPAV